MEQTPPFTVYSSSLHTKEGRTILRCQLYSVAGGLIFKRICYRGVWAAISTSGEGEYLVLKAKFEKGGKELTMHADPRKEVGNQPPFLKKGKGEKECSGSENQALLVYEYKGSEFNYVLQGITPLQTGE